MDRTSRPPGGRVSSAGLGGFLLAALLLSVTAGLAASCSEYKIKAFKCGVALASDKDVAQSCTEPRQFCICETNDCAETVDETVCESGLRYVKSPYAEPPASIPAADAGADADASTDAGTTAGADKDDRCVPRKIADRTVKIASTEDNKFCPGEEPKGGSGGGTSTSSGGSTGSTTTSTAGGGTGGGQ